MPRRTRYANQPLDTPGGRVELILREVYHGDQSKMAAETGNSQPQISLVARGERFPGPRFIENLARNPRVNVEWLRTGIGEPFIPEQRPVSTSGLSLPVYKHPTHRTSGDSGLRPELHLRVGDLFGPTMYLLEAQSDDPVVHTPELKIAPGDLLVMETDHTAWGGNPRSLIGKLVVVRLRGSDGVDYTLARVESSPDTGRLTANIFGTGTVPLAQSGGEAGAENEASQPGCKGPHASVWDPLAEFRKLASGGQVAAPKGFAALPLRPFVWAAPSVDDVVAVCVLMIRR